jgi:cell division septum initiation protein DivIVA
MDTKSNTKRFKIVFRGYDAEEVNDFIATKSARYEDALAEQKSRILELIEENKSLAAENAELIKQEKKLSQTLLYANEKADQIIADARMLADAEIERVKVFQERWEFFAKKMLGELSPKELLLYERLNERIDAALRQFSGKTAEMRKVAAADTSMQQINPLKKVRDVLDRDLSISSAIKSHENPQGNLAKKPTDAYLGAGQPAIGLDEVYKPTESLSELLEDLV